MFRFGYLRFHFFWITLLFPWLALALALLLRRTRWAFSALVGVLVLAVAFGWARGVFDVPRFYRSVSEFRQTEIRCLTRQLGSGQPVSCPGFSLMGLPDLTRAYTYARDIQASFVRYLPIVEREGFGRDVVYLAGPQLGMQAPWHNVLAAPGGWLQSQGDAALRVPLPDPEPLRRCRVMGVQLTLETSQPDVAQLFYRPLGQADITEWFSVRKSYQPDAAGQVRLEFSIDTESGFEPELRVDPLDAAARFRLSELRVTGRLQAEP